MDMQGGEREPPPPPGRQQSVLGKNHFTGEATEAQAVGACENKQRRDSNPGFLTLLTQPQSLQCGAFHPGSICV